MRREKGTGARERFCKDEVVLSKAPIANCQVNIGAVLHGTFGISVQSWINQRTAATTADTQRIGLP